VGGSGRPVVTSRLPVSAVLIVRNEQELLPRCLASLDGVTDLVVCDTGSEDDTVAVAESYGARVVRFDWCDDFAAARNYAKTHAANDWVLVIDADELLVSPFVDVEVAAAEATGRAVSVRVVPESETGWHRSVRLMRRDVDYVGKVHEVPSEVASYESDVTVMYGYSPAHDRDPDRVLRILSSIEDPTPRDLYYLAREHYYRADWEQAVDVLDRYLSVAEWMPERADGWLMKARCLWQLERGDDARTACAQAIVNNAHFREALVFMAEMSWPDNAEQWLVMAESADNRDVLFVRV
jgi:glycosyltransferase involved in cell wall biosynthesis